MICDVFAVLESRDIGLTLETASTVYQNYRYDYGIMMLCSSMIVFLILGLYLDAVLPKTYGQRQSVFCCLKCFCKRK